MYRSRTEYESKKSGNVQSDNVQLVIKSIGKDFDLVPPCKHGQSVQKFCRKTLNEKFIDELNKQTIFEYSQRKALNLSYLANIYFFDTTASKKSYRAMYLEESYKKL